MAYTPEQYKEWYETNKESCKVRGAQWAKNNPEKVKQRHKRFRENNPEKLAQYYLQYKKQNPRSYLYSTAKKRAKQLHREFTITLDDLPIIPEYCPLLGVKLDSWITPEGHRPSLDRIDSRKGYVPGNVQIISHRANVLKNNATADELLCLAINMIQGEVN